MSWCEADSSITPSLFCISITNQGTYGQVEAGKFSIDCYTEIRKMRSMLPQNDFRSHEKMNRNQTAKARTISSSRMERGIPRPDWRGRSPHQIGRLTSAFSLALPRQTCAKKKVGRNPSPTEENQ
jgi:hypothetical protein